MFGIFTKKSIPRKSVQDWSAILADKPDWQLDNIIKNPGEFVVDMRHAAALILKQRMDNSGQNKI